MELKEVFEPIMNIIKNFQKKEKDISKQAAKDRLKLVLMQDRASVSPDFFEMMKKEIIDVIKKYVEIDEESLEVGAKIGADGSALFANIPIKNVKVVATNGEEAEHQSDDIKRMIANEISEEINKISDEMNDVTVEIESNQEEITTDVAMAKPQEVSESESKTDKEISVEDIAKNVATEMKKSLKANNTATKTVSKPRTTSTTTRKRATTKKTN